MSLFSGKRLPLVLHVGLPETGTQSLQRTLLGRRQALAAVGVVVPAAGVQREAHHELAWQFGFTRGPAPAVRSSPEQIVAAWHQEVAAVKGATGVVTSEYLSLPGRHSPLVALLSQQFDLRVVLYLHRHDLWMPLVYARAVRANTSPKWGRGYENFLSFRKAGDLGRSDAFRPIVDAWAGQVGRENVIVRPFEVSQIGDNPAADLLRAIGASDAAVAAVARPVAGDPPLSFEALQFIDIVQHTTLPVEIKRHLVSRCVAQDPGRTPGSPLASPGLRSGQVAAHFDDYEYIAQRFLGRSDGLLFREPTPTDGAATWKPPAMFTNMWFAERLCEYLGQGSEAVMQALHGLGEAGAGTSAG